MLQYCVPSLGDAARGQRPKNPEVEKFLDDFRKSVGSAREALKSALTKRKKRHTLECQEDIKGNAQRARRAVAIYKAVHNAVGDMRKHRHLKTARIFQSGVIAFSVTVERKTARRQLASAKKAAVAAIRRLKRKRPSPATQNRHKREMKELVAAKKSIEKAERVLRDATSALEPTSDQPDVKPAIEKWLPALDAAMETVDQALDGITSLDDDL